MQSVDIISSVFAYLTIGEISDLSTINTQFNLVNQNQLMWKKRVLNEYGIDYVYDDETWEEMAKNLFQADMINLNKVWIDEITYGKLVENCLNICDYIVDFLDDNDATCFIFPDYVVDLKTAKRYVRFEYDGHHSSNVRPCERFDKHHNNILRNEESVMKTIKYSTREFAIIANAMCNIDNYNGDLI
uniref:F-box-like family protein n=1 Tax=Pithovirus LCPAC403 TaxID=2506596 RepID=A0A481ZAY5_9VIRU|nr:MAG: uncharacterized protein LCPAC403_00710 [Pithovirus LCPAC403]